MKVVILISVVSFGFHGVWELLQCSEFLHLKSPATIQSMIIASLGDVVLTWVAVLIVGVMEKSAFWFIDAWSLKATAFLTLINVVLAISVEKWALQSGRWMYSSTNPRIPGTDLSWLPVLQLIVLVPLTLVIVKKVNRTTGQSQ